MYGPFFHTFSASMAAESMADGDQQQQQRAVRLFVGGLPTDLAAAELASRLAPFGSVRTVELIHAQGGGCRGFAYVDFVPASDSSLAKCMTAVSAHCSFLALFWPSMAPFWPFMVLFGAYGFSCAFLTILVT